MKPKSLILLTALLLTALLCAAPVAADAVTHNGKTYTTYDQIYASTTLSSSEKLSLVQEMAGWTEELAAYMEWKNSGGLEAYQAAVSGGNSTSSDYGWNEAPGDGLGDGGTNIEPEYSYQERQAYDAAYAAYQAEFAENYAATAAYTGSGSGTEADPYIITTPVELQSIQDDLTAYYKLGNDIDLTGISWSPIGSSSVPFSGSLDGNGYSISNLEITSTNSVHTGFFAVVSNSEIKNIQFIDSNIVITNGYAANIHGTGIISGAVNSDSRVTFSNIYIKNANIDVTISASNQYIQNAIGGLFGYSGYDLAETGQIIINDCIIDVDISGKNLAGTYRYLSFGAVVGHNKIPNTISNTVAYGTILTPSQSVRGCSVGGICGGGTALTVSNSVALQDSLTAITTGAGGYQLHRISLSSNTFNNNYANADMLLDGATTTGTTNDMNGANVDAATAATQSFYQNTLGWDFVNTWYWDSETNTPQLQVFRSSIPPTISAISATPSIGGQQDTYTLSVSASTTASGGIASYQWYGRIGSSGEWQAISDGTSATYQFVPGAYALGDFYFKCVVTGADGGVIDSYNAGFTNVKITVVLAPQITSPAATPASGPLTQTITLSADVTSSETATYQWQELVSGTWTNISGATAATATYTVSVNDAAPTTHSYRLLATNVGGTTTSTTVAYTSVAAPSISSVTANPIIGPLTQSVTLSATVSGATSYQWQELSGSTWQNIAGATSATYTVSVNDAAPTTHSYRLLATNIGGTSTSNTVTYQSVVAPPTITAVSVSPTIGQYTQTITLSAEVTDSGPAPTTYQWQQSPEGQNTWTNIPGATTALWVGQLTFAGATDFRLIATGTGGQTISETVTYYIALPGEIQSLTATPSVVTLPGSTTLTATGSNVISWEWQQYTSGVWTPIGYSASVTQRFTDAGTYQFRVLATGADGAVVTSETIEVIAGFAPSVSITSPNDGTRYQSGERIPLTATITGTDPTWEWSFGSQDVQTGGNSQTTWVEYGIDGRYTISIRVVSLFGTDEDSITIISGRESRPIATTPPIELESDGIFEATDSLTPNENGMPDITGFIMSMSKPFTDMIGAWFYFVLFAVPYLIIWIRQKNIIIPSILGVLFAAWVLIQLPAAALPAAIALITLSVTGGLYGIYVKLQNR